MTPLKPYQREGSRAIYDFGGRALLADEMGLGKTIQVLNYVVKTKQRLTVVVCPASLKLNWEREAAHHVGLLSDVLEGRRIPKRKRAISARHPIIIVNYEILHYWIDYLKELKPTCLVIDEAHYVKNRKSQRYEAVKEMASVCKRIVAVSGTPLTNNPAELWPTLNILLPEQFSSFFKFAFRWCKPKKLPWGWSYGGARDLEKLHAKLKKLCMIRRLKKDVLKDLPPKVRQVVPMYLRNRKEYDLAANDFLNWLNRVSPERARKAKKAQAVTRVGYLLRLAARLKKDFVFDWIDNYLESSERKLVVFTKHRKMVEMLKERYGRRAVVVDGSVKGEKRQQAVDQFQRNPQVRVFIGNIKAAGVGLTLTAADTCVFADLPWTPGDLVQAEDRIHRIGQKSTAFIYYLVARDTIEERLCKILREKQSILEGVLDGQGNGDNLDILQDLLKSIKQKGLFKK